MLLEPLTIEAINHKTRVVSFQRFYVLQMKMGHLTITDSHWRSLVSKHKNLEVEFFPGSTASCGRVINCLRNLTRFYDSLILFIDGNGITAWGRQLGKTPEQVSDLFNIISSCCRLKTFQKVIECNHTAHSIRIDTEVSLRKQFPVKLQSFKYTWKYLVFRKIQRSLTKMKEINFSLGNMC